MVFSDSLLILISPRIRWDQSLESSPSILRLHDSAHQHLPPCVLSVQRSTQNLPAQLHVVWQVSINVAFA